MILNPGEYFTVVRQLPDPSDSSTYYVQAVIRNARTDAIITTLNLTSRGGRRFSKEYQIPADPSGLGFYIAIHTAVYTDSGYSTPSDVYGQEIQTYLVDNRFRSLNAGGGADVDYKKVRSIMVEVLDGLKLPEADLNPILERLDKSFGTQDEVLALVKTVGAKAAAVGADVVAVKNAATRIEGKKFPTLDLSPVIAKIDALPPPERLNLAPVMAALEELPQKLHIEEILVIANSLAAVRDALKTPELKAILDQVPEVAKAVSDIDANAKKIVIAVGKMGPELARIVEDAMYGVAKQETPAKDPVEKAPKPDYGKEALGIIGRHPLPKPKIG